MAESITQLGKQFESEGTVLVRVREEIQRVIVGLDVLIDRLLLALLCNGHVLIEGVPGLAKTLLVTTLAKTLRATFHRVQFTPDLLPGDLIGTQMYNPGTGAFTPHKGPVFCNILLADEINRAPAKVQSALLEAMQERQVTIGEQCYLLDEPFLVMATQNPIEQAGTYPLPEAQVDRFFFKVKVTYPSRPDEHEILRRMATTSPLLEVAPVIGPADILNLRRLLDEVFVDEKIDDYILNLVNATREPAAYGLDLADLIRYGASPRATIFLAMAARGHALLSGRGYVVPEDVKAIAMDVLRHRVIITYEAQAEDKTAEDILNQIFDTVEVP